MFPSISGNAMATPATMDLLQPWMIAAIALLALLMLVLIVVAARKGRKSAEGEAMRIAKGGDESQPVRKSQAERQGTRSARGEAPENEESRAREAAGNGVVAGVAAGEAAADAVGASVAGAAVQTSAAGEDINGEILKRAAERKQARGSSNAKGKGSHVK